MNVLEFQKHIIKQSGCKDHFEFINRSKDHLQLWNDLNEAGFAPFRHMKPEHYPDEGLNASVVLGKEELLIFNQRFANLK